MVAKQFYCFSPIGFVSDRVHALRKAEMDRNCKNTYVQRELHVNLSERRERERGTKEYFQGLSQEDSASEDWSISPGLASSGPKAQKISTHPPIGNSGLKTTQPTVLGPIQGSLSNLLIIICPCAKTGHREKMY